VVCPAVEKEKEMAVHIFSEEWFGTESWRTHGGAPSFLVEYLAKEAGVASLSWLEISRARQYSQTYQHPSQPLANLTWECHHR
jgi:hypothetical protein